MNPDGGNLRQLIPNGGWASWSHDGRWVYYNENVQVPNDSARRAEEDPPRGRGRDHRS